MLRILIADHADSTRSLIRGVLYGSDLNCSVVAEARSGVEAVKLYKIYRPDLTIMDIVLPYKDGIEALKEIKSADHRAKIVMCSVLNTRAVVEEVMHCGAAGFIDKPLNPECLLQYVTRLTTKVKLKVIR